jgi:ThiF family
MALAPFFERVYGAVGGHLSVSRESLTASLEAVTAGVHCGRKCRRNDIWIAELVTNLLARLYPRIAISGGDSHVEELRQLALSINPLIEFANDSPGRTSICIGAAELEDAIYPTSAGWVACVGHTPSQVNGPDNPYAAGAAACLACAELFRRIFLKSGAESDVRVSLLDFGKETGHDFVHNTARLDEVVVVGVGAVGNAAIWALARDRKAKGKLWLVDSEELTLSNLQRYVLGTNTDVSRSKVQLAKGVLDATNLDVEACQTTLECFADGRSGMDIPTICISVDNIETRRSAQALLPKLIVNGWTGEQALGVSWHVISRDAACLACLYQPHGQGPSATEQAARALGLPIERATLLWVTRQAMTDEDLRTVAEHLGVNETVLEPWRGKAIGDFYTDIVCGAVPLDVTGVGRIETVPLAHQSALAGILMAAELVKRTNDPLATLSQSEPLISWDDVLRPPPRLWTKPRPRESGCICGDPDYQAVYRRKWEIKSQSKGSPVSLTRK